MNDEVRQFQEEIFKRVVLGITVIAMALALAIWIVAGVSSPWFYRAVALLLIAGVTFIVRRFDRLVVASYVLVLQLIGLVIGMFLQAGAITSFVPYLFIPIVVIAGFLLIPLASLLVAAGSIIAALLIVNLTGQLNLANLTVLLPPFSLTLLMAVLSAQNKRYITVLGQRLLEDRKLLKDRTLEMMETSVRAEQLEQDIAELKAQVKRARREAKQVEWLAGQRFDELYQLLQSAIQELEMSVRTLEEAIEQLGELPGSQNYTNLVEVAWQDLYYLKAFMVNLQEIAQVEYGNIQLDYQPIDVQRLVSEAVSTTKGLARGKDLEVRYQIPEDLPPLQADPVRMRQVFLHILNNAIRFSDRGIIEVQAELNANGELMVFVSDTGIGMYREETDLIFEKFGRGSGSMAQPRQGAGLGLAISKKLVELHGGRIWVTSVLGIGSTFYMALPSATATLPAKSTTFSPELTTDQVDLAESVVSLPAARPTIPSIAVQQSVRPPVVGPNEANETNEDAATLVMPKSDETRPAEFPSVTTRTTLALPIAKEAETPGDGGTTLVISKSPVSRPGTHRSRYQILFWRYVPLGVKATDVSRTVRKNFPPSFLETFQEASIQNERSGAAPFTTSGFRWGREQEREGTADDVAVLVVQEVIDNWNLEEALADYEAQKSEIDQQFIDLKELNGQPTLPGTTPQSIPLPPALDKLRSEDDNATTRVMRGSPTSDAEDETLVLSKNSGSQAGMFAHPIRRFGSTYIRRFGFILDGLLLVVAVTVGILAIVNGPVGQQMADTATAVSAASTRKAPGTSAPAGPTPEEIVAQLPIDTPSPAPQPSDTLLPAELPSSTPPNLPTPVPPTSTPVDTATAIPVQQPPPTLAPPSETPTQPPTTSPDADSTLTILDTLSHVGISNLLPLAFFAGQTGGLTNPELGIEDNVEPTGLIETSDNSRLSWSPTGEFLFAGEQNGNRDIYAANDSNPSSVRLTTSAGDDWQPDWSPDGKKVAFSSNRNGNFEIYVMDADGSNLVQLTDSRGFDEWPVWSPDGRQIAFVSDRDGNVEIYSMDADGKNQQRVTDNPADDWPATWSPDGNRLVFASERDGDWNLYITLATGGEAARLTNAPGAERDPIWSRDGKRIAFVYNGDSNWDVYTLSVPNGIISEIPPSEWTQVTNTPTDERYPTWQQ